MGDFPSALILPRSPAPAAANVMMGGNDPRGPCTTHPYSDFYCACHPIMKTNRNVTPSFPL